MICLMENLAIKKVILVGLNLPEIRDFDEGMRELSNLALALAYQPVDMITQKAPVPFSATYIGSGKVEEVKAAVLQSGAETVIFDAELSPVHLRNLEEALGVTVIDRTMLILEIFSQRAKTPEAILQVSLAKAQYMLPRIIGSDTSYSRQKSGKGSLGAGEQKLELQKRQLRDSIHRDRQALEALTIQRRTQRVQRKKEGLFQVAIVGYTNSGKSSLMNSWLNITNAAKEKRVFQKDMLFATLETAARLIELPNQRKFLAVDTVGFVRRLPHHLVEAFKSTLEEVKEAHLIVHVVDSANPEYRTHIAVVEDVLRSIGVKDIPVIYAFNKMDLASKVKEPLPKEALYISALTGKNVDVLIDKILFKMTERFQEVTLHLPYDKAFLINYIKSNGELVKEQYLDEYIVVIVKLSDEDLAKFSPYIQGKHLH